MGFSREDKMNRSWFLLTLVALLVLFVMGIDIVFAQDSENVDLLGSTHKWDEVYGVAVDGDFAYLATSGTGLAIVDISNPSQPMLVTQFDEERCEGVAVGNGHAFLATKDDGMVVLDVNDPFNPIFVTRYGAGNDELTDITLIGTTAYILISGRVAIVDVSDPASPEYLGNDGLEESCFGFAISPPFLCFTSAEGIHLVNISNPAVPQEISFVFLPGAHEKHAAGFSGDFLYTTRSDSLLVFDISDPVFPLAGTAIPVDPDPILSYRDIAIDGDLLYLADADGGLKIIDISIPMIPAQLSHHDTYENAQGVTFTDDHVLVADNWHGLRLIDASDPYFPEEIGFLEYVNYTHSISVAGEYAFVVRNNLRSGLYTVDISDPTDMRVVNFFLLEHYAQALTLVGSTGYLVTGGNYHGLRILDLSDPISPVELGSYGDFYTNYYSVTVVGDYAYLTSDDYGIQILDVSQPSNPTLLGSIDTSGLSFDCFVRDNIGYIADGIEGLQIIDVSDPTYPTELGRIPTNDLADEVAVVGDYAFVSIRYQGIQVIDISDPSNPVGVNYIDTYRPNCVDIVDGFAYVADDMSGLKVYDVSDPLSIIGVGYYDTDGFAEGVFVYDGQVFVSDFWSLDVYEFTEPTLLQITLTPANPLVIPQGGNLEYAASLVSNLPSPFNVDIWTYVVLPGGFSYGPIWQINNYPMTPNTVIEVDAINQQIPMIASVGTYTYHMKAGQFPQFIAGEDEFQFEVVAAGIAETDNNSDWIASGYEHAFAASNEDRELIQSRPGQYSLSEAYPNPFNPTTTITVALPEKADLDIAVYNVAGQLVATLVDGHTQAGTLTLTFDATGLASGLYFVRATVPGHLNSVQKVMLVR
jgi:hypothetical protein